MEKKQTSFIDRKLILIIVSYYKTTFNHFNKNTRLVFLSIGTEACELDQTQHGCRIDNGACTCAYGCRSEFRYLTRKECQDALKVNEI